MDGWMDGCTCIYAPASILTFREHTCNHVCIPYRHGHIRDGSLHDLPEFMLKNWDQKSVREDHQGRQGAGVGVIERLRRGLLTLKTEWSAYAGETTFGDIPEVVWTGV